MYFCEKCDNMYYLSISGDNQDCLIYHCKNCGNTNKNIATNASIVQTSSNVEDLSKMVNEYTKFDPTLPQIDTIDCPNEKCDTNTKKTPKRILYIRYDEDNMKFMFLCSTCDNLWKIQDSS